MAAKQIRYIDDQRAMVRSLTPIICVLVCALHTGAAFADSTQDYDGSYCEVQDSTNLASAQYFNGTVKNIGSSDLVITCPVVKTTSNSTGSGDQLKTISIVVSGGAHTTVSAHIEVRDANEQATADPAVIQKDDSTPFNNVANPSHATENISLTTVTTVQGYYSRSSTHAEWFYPEMQITLSPGTTLETYEVTEAGTFGSDLIFPSSYCYPTVDNTCSYTTGRIPPGEARGYVEVGDDSTPTKFEWDCTNLTNSTNAVFDLMIGPPIGGSNMLGCQSIDDGSEQIVVEWPSDSTWPPVDLQWEGEFPSGFDCWGDTTDPSGLTRGDAKIISIRTTGE